MERAFELPARFGSVGEPSLDPNLIDAIASKTLQGGIGSIASVMGGSLTPPPGYLLCDGRAVSRAVYADLFAKIGTTYGAGDGSSTFNLPNFAAGLIATEPSLGTLHPRTTVSVLAIGASVMGTYKIDCSAVVPIGTKAVWISGNCASNNNSYHEFKQWGGAYASIFVICGPNYSNIGYSGLMMLDSNRWGQVVISNANNTGGINTNLSGYCI